MDTPTSRTVGIWACYGGLRRWHQLAALVCILTNPAVPPPAFPSGTVAILAGHKPQSSYVEGRRAIQVLNLQNRTLDSVGSLQFGHWLATATRLPNGMVSCMYEGGIAEGFRRCEGPVCAAPAVSQCAHATRPHLKTCNPCPIAPPPSDHHYE